VIRLLGRTPPRRVVWNFSPEAMTIDSVPHVVRVPLLFQWSVAHLAPERRVGQFEILRPLRPGERPHLAWWRRRIGTTTNLGHVPEAAQVHGRPCSTGSRCGTYAVVELPSGQPRPAQVSVSVTVGGLRFGVAFQPSGATRYVIPLDSLWFWRVGGAVSASVHGDGVADAHVTILRRTRDRDLLY
jgi:hypothetical protein